MRESGTSKRVFLSNVFGMLKLEASALSNCSNSCMKRGGQSSHAQCWQMTKLKRIVMLLAPKAGTVNS